MKRNMKRNAAVLAAGFTLSMGMYACNSGASDTDKKDSTTQQEAGSASSSDLKPTGPKPAWGESIKPEMQVVIEKLASLNGKPIETLSATEARQQPTPADAVMAIMKEKNIAVPAPKCDTVGKDIPVEGGSIHARVYIPKEGNGPFPVIVYYHGGGWVIATNDTYMASAQGLSDQVNAIVVSVEYRKGPEYLFPAAHKDAFAAYQWTLANAASWKGDPKKVAVVGESAGGNLATNVSIMARDKGVQLPVYQVLVYPVANNNMNTESYNKYAAAKPLNKPMMAWFVKNALGSEQVAANPMISLVKANLKGLPPTTVITAEIDPLHDDGKMLADKLKDAGVEVDYKDYDGVTHEFFGMAAVVPQAKDAQEYASGKLKDAFKK
jgi:acetyl esterase